MMYLCDGSVSTFSDLLMIMTVMCNIIYYFFFFKQKTAYEMRISDWSSDVCSSDLAHRDPAGPRCRLFDGGHGQSRQGPQVLGRDFRSARPRPARHAGHVHQFGRRSEEIGRASCRERVCQYVYISVVAVQLKKHIN